MRAEIAIERLADTRTGRNGRHARVGLLRQSVFGRLAGYEDVNDAERLRRDSAMRRRPPPITRTKNRINESRWSIARFPPYSFYDGPAASYALIAAASIRTLFFSSSNRRSASARRSAIAEWRRAAALNSSSPETTSAQNDF
jgi:hypothetical protein